MTAESNHADQLAWMAIEHKEATNDLAQRLFNVAHRRALLRNLETGVVSAAYVTAIANSLAQGCPTRELVNAFVEAIIGVLPTAVEHAFKATHGDPAPSEEG